MPDTNPGPRQVSVDEFRRDFDRIMDEAAAHHEPITVRRGEGKPDVVMIAAEEWEGWMETIHLLSSPANAERLRRSIAQLDADEMPEADRRFVAE